VPPFHERSVQPFQPKNAISLTIRINTFLWLVRRLLQHFVLSKTPRLYARAYDAVNTTLYFVYTSLTIAHDFELGPVESVHLNDMFADQKRQLCTLAESSRCALEEVGMLYLLSTMENGRST